MKEERRFLPLGIQIETREDGKVKIAGYAAKFGKISEDLGGFREKIAHGAFKKALKTSDPRALFNHNRDFVLGRQSAGTLAVKEDKEGLYIEIDPPDTTFARDLMVSIRRGDITQQSFGFTVAKDSWEDLEKGSMPLRTLEEIGELFDVSPVTYPAYPDTEVALRSLDTAKAGGETAPEEKPMAFMPAGETRAGGETAPRIETEVGNKEVTNNDFWSGLQGDE